MIGVAGDRSGILALKFQLVTAGFQRGSGVGS